MLVLLSIFILYALVFFFSSVRALASHELDISGLTFTFSVNIIVIPFKSVNFLGFDTLKLNISYCQVNSDNCSNLDSFQRTSLHFILMSFQLS